MVKSFKPPCISLEQTEFGQLNSGVYQVGIAYSIDELVLTDYYFSPAFKAYSDRPNIGFDIEINCEDSPFDQIHIILVTNTRESSLVTYSIGYFPLNTKRLNINNVDNALILSTTQATQKRTVFDKSTHIAANGETLLLGKHHPIQPLNYQPQANNIEVEWLEIKVPKKDAHKYPSFMRDEVYSIGIEWLGSKGSLGESARAGLVTRGLAEIARLTVALGGKRDTLMGQCGVGDLMLTYASSQSRNFSLGVQIGQGRKLEDILAERTSVTEGVATAKATAELSRRVGIEMPIVKTVCACLYDNLDPRQAFNALMNRPVRAEHE